MISGDVPGVVELCGGEDPCAAPIIDGEPVISRRFTRATPNSAVLTDRIQRTAGDRILEALEGLPKAMSDVSLRTAERIVQPRGRRPWAGADETGSLHADGFSSEETWCGCLHGSERQFRHRDLGRGRWNCSAR